MGITPGGPTAASFMSYGIARQASRTGGRPFGTGRPEGIVAPEAADHSAGTCARSSRPPTPAPVIAPRLHIP